MIFGIGTFSSKILVFLLLPFLTRVLSKEEYGSIDIILQTANFLLPIVSLGIAQSVIRFALDKQENQAKVFSSGVQIFLVGFLAFAALSPLLQFIPFVSNRPALSSHIMLLVIFVFTSCMRSLCSNFVRGLQRIKLFAVDGVLTTIMTLSFTLYFLFYLKMGITGYILAIICADGLSVIFLFLTAKLWKFLRLQTSGFKKRMLAYSLPMIPTIIFWWVTNVSDRYMLTGMLGEGATGLYAVSYKIPTIMVLISTIFIEAWHIGSVTEDEAGRKSFFSNVFESYSSLIFIASSALILLSKPILKILVAPAFFEAWQFIPVLILGTTFSCFVSFFGSVYIVFKKSTHAMWTTLVGAAANIGLNLLLIPIFGIQGAAIATFASFLLVFIIRAWDETRFLNFPWNKWNLIICTLLLIAQSYIMVKSFDYWVLYSIGILLLLGLINYRKVAGLLRQRNSSQ